MTGSGRCCRTPGAHDIEAAPDPARPDQPNEGDRIRSPVRRRLSEDRLLAPRTSQTELLDDPQDEGESSLRTNGDTQSMDVPPDPTLKPTHETDASLFQLVTYKKNRPNGIPIVFRCLTESDLFWNVNPNLIAREVLTTIQEKVLRHRINKYGTLIVHVSYEHSAQRLLGLTVLAGIAVQASIPQSYLCTTGRIIGVPRRYSEAQLLDYFCSSGATEVQRELAYSRESDGSAKAIVKSSVLLTFQPGYALPAEIPLGFTYFPLSEYIEPPTQCFNCQKFGHIARDCRGPQRCKVCAGPHVYKQCTSRRKPTCANCGGQQNATYRDRTVPVPRERQWPRTDGEYSMLLHQMAARLLALPLVLPISRA
ncbi:uncharacterized protein LOC135378202 [Ornithodoros turicata]|uniref:uncharacterized protein LOC135378202 n=1 Tax=Ornithodoros turicata TaxID=34597 RepID=UPI003139F13D